MVRGKIPQGNEKINLNSSDSRELDNDDNITLPRGGPTKNNGLSSSKPEDEQKTFPTFIQSTDEQQQMQPKRGRGRPRKIPIATTITNNDIDQNSSISNNSETSSSKIITNHHCGGELNDNINSNDDQQHNIISVIEIVDESQDDSITNIIIHSESNVSDNLEYSNESQNDLSQHNNEDSNQLQNDTNSIIIEEIIDKPAMTNFNDDDDLQSEIEMIKKEPENFDIEAKINTESIITISSEESNFKTEFKSRDTPIYELTDRGSGGSGDIVSSPDILHVHINPNSARTYQNKRKSKNGNDININLDNLSNNNSILDKNILELNQFKQNNIEVEENLQIQNDNTINSIECRRSSRKKTMKYDVRDLLNKNRKKIQIEARIDSLPKKTIDNATSTISNEIKLMSDNNCKISPFTGITKMNEFHEKIPKTPEPPQLSPILLNDKKISPPQLNSGINFTKNLIQIQSRKSFENGTNQLPPPPPLKSIADLDRKNLTIPNGLYANELSKNNKIYSFHDAFNSGIIKSVDNDCPIRPTNLKSFEMSQIIKNTSLTQSASTNITIPPPVLSSMVKSPLLNIKFKHQNLAIRKSFDNLINANSSTHSLNDSNKNTSKDIQSQLIIDQTKKNEFDLEKIEKPIKVKGKRGRPPKNKLLSPKISDTSLALTKQENKYNFLQNSEEKSIKESENIHLLQSPEKDKIIQSPENLDKLSIDNKIKGKQNYEISTITNNTDLNFVNSNYSNIFDNFKFMETKVKIKRLSNRSSTESIDSNTNNKNNDFTDFKTNDVHENKKNKEITESNKNKEEKIVQKCNQITKELDVRTEVISQETDANVQIENISEEFVVDVQNQNIEKETTATVIQSVQMVKNTDKIISVEETELQRKKNKNKVKEEKSSKLSPVHKKRNSDLGKVELEKSHQNLAEIFKTHSSEKKKLKEETTKVSSSIEHLQESPKKQKPCKKNLEDKYGKSVLIKTKEKCDESERKIIVPQNKLFLENEKIHELKLQKLERKKTNQNKEKESNEKFFKKLKKISVDEKTDQTKDYVEKKEMENYASDIIKYFDKSQEEIKIPEEQKKSTKEILENKILPIKSVFSILTQSENKTPICESIVQKSEKISELEGLEKDEQPTDFKSQKDIQIFEKLAEKLIDNEINSLNCNENISNQKDQHNEFVPYKFEEKLTLKLSDNRNSETNIAILDANNDKSILQKIIQLPASTILNEKTDNLINIDKFQEANSCNIQINEILDTIKINSAENEIINKKEKIFPGENQISNATVAQISKDNNDSKVLVVNSSSETLSASPSTDSNDPLKDIEKFLEAAGNLLSRSFSSEDEKDPSRRRGRSGTRFKDCATEDGNSENITNRGEIDGLSANLDERNSKIPNFQDVCNTPKSAVEELKIIHKLHIDITKINSEESKEISKDMRKTEDLQKSLYPEFPSNQISVYPDSENISNNIQSENYESNTSEFLSNTLTELPPVTNASLNFSHKFPSKETLNLAQNLPQIIKHRTPGPRTPPFPPPNDLPIENEISLLQSSLKSEKSLLILENNLSTTTGSLDCHSDSMTSNSNSSKSTELKTIKTKSSKKIENDLKLIKKLKRKDEKKLKKKDGITDELKRTIKEMKKIKKSTSDENFIQGTLSKAAMKSYSPVNSIDNGKTDGDSRSLDDLLDIDDNQIIYDQNNKNIRRSHRLKTITKSQSVGRGLVRDRERYDKEYDDIKPDLAVIDAQNAKFLKDMEERLSQFQVIRDNEYKCERVISKEAKKMICDCFLTREEEERGEFGCGEDCLNRLLMIECGPKCTVGDRCTNRRFQRAHYAPCKVFQTEKKGCGIMADAEIPCGQFIMEYVGEVLNSNQFEKRAEMYSQDKNKHYYFMALRSDAIIDATTRGNISRFINHSCDPNAETQKWTVNGELRIGFFTTRTILSGEEITFDYQFQRYGKEAQRCYCETSNCRGWIGEEPDDSDEEELEDESEDDDKIKTEIKKEITPKIIKEIPNDQQNIFKPKSVQEISQKTDTDIDKENIEIIKTKPDTKEKKKRGRKKRLDFRLGKKNYEFIDDPDLEDEVLRLLESGLKNQVQTLCLSRLFVRAKQLETRLNLLQILRKGEMSCRRLFLDYHGLKLLHGWMSETTELVKDTENNLKIRLNLLETLECLPIPNKTMLKDSKVFQTVQNWSQDKTSTESSPNDGSPNDNSNSGLTTPINISITAKSTTNFVNIDSEKPILLNTNENLIVENPIKLEIKRISTKLITNWDGLPEVFRIPRKERVEQMKEHEREADKQYAALKLVDDESEIRRNHGRFVKDIKEYSIISNNTDLTPGSGGSIGKYKWSRDIKSEIIKERRKEFEKSSHQDGLSKLQRRQIFAAKVAQHEADKRLADEKRESEIKCKFYGLDPLTTHPRDFPFCVNPATGQWYTIDRRKIQTPPSHAHIKVPPKPQSTKPEDYHLPLLDLPPFWKFAIDPHKGRIYYYHMKIRIPQWEPPIKILPLNDGSTIKGDEISGKSMLSISKDIQNDENDSSDSGSESGDSVNDKNKDETTSDGKLMQALNPEQKKLERKKKRYALLVQERPISPRREEDRAYNQIEMRRYKENKEKIRRRKEEIKRRKIQLARHLTDQQNNTDIETNNDNNEETIASDQNIESDSGVSATSSGVEPLPIADYLLSSDEEETITTFCDANLIEKIVKGEKIVDELDALNINRPLKRLLSFKEKNSTSILSSVEHKSKKSKTDEKKVKSDDEIKKSKSSSKLNNPKYIARKAKEKFRADIAGIIVSHLTPYRKDTCKTGKITKNEDFKHLARKLTHFVMVKELKHCDLTGQQLIVTDSVKNKSREFIKKYMAKYGEIYIRPENDPEFKEIPH